MANQFHALVDGSNPSIFLSSGAKCPLIVTDMPFGSYEAVLNAQRLLNEGGADCVRVKAGRKRVDTIRTLVDSVSRLSPILDICQVALDKLQHKPRWSLKTRWPCKKLVPSRWLECVPTLVTKHITGLLKIPTIGIGAGPETDGKVLVFHDLLGMMQHPHHEQHVPKFCKRYANMSKDEAAKLDGIIASTFSKNE